MFSQQPLKFIATLYAKPFSSLAFSDEEHGVSNLTMVDSECDFDADVGKTVELHSVVDDEEKEEGCGNVGDSTTVELENGDCIVASDDDDDDVGLERCEGYLHIASRNPVEVYRELRNAENGAKQTRCDWVCRRYQAPHLVSVCTGYETKDKYIIAVQPTVVKLTMLCNSLWKPRRVSVVVLSDYWLWKSLTR